MTTQRGAMEKVTTKRMSLYSGRTHPDLAQEVADHLGIGLGNPGLVEFANGEVRARFSESIRGSDVFIMQTHCGHNGRSINDSIMEQLIMIDTAYRASAKRITAVCPFYGYARQDRKAEGREPITARMVADLFKSAGAKRMVSIDLHSGQIQGFFEGPVDHLTAMPVLENYLRQHADAPVIVSPDAGRIKVAERMAQHLGDRGADLAFIYKRRPKGTTNVAEAKEVMGDVEGRLCILTDDMIDSGATICSAADVLMARGAREVWTMATHGVLSGPAIERLQKSVITRVVVTNTLPLAPEKQIDKIEVLSIAAHRRHAQRRLRRHQRQRDLRRREPVIEGAAPPPAGPDATPTRGIAAGTPLAGSPLSDFTRRPTPHDSAMISDIQEVPSPSPAFSPSDRLSLAIGRVCQADVWLEYSLSPSIDPSPAQALEVPSLQSHSPPC